ncbi:cytidylyltransferase domain-containing protein [Colwellia hornerae]|uniref:Acylneuraminate cytidylyltransferase family protein n=1 Tax=Colwellia hornerae TaxID=89402 RepID=A0A5C6QJS5_9GAMM|nr:acylneuraminate cytidylyltransferase family protein [Colwellia hornerae]TWX54060.1 acylneuraminate cytidylyltransferase family protein [Colwellia hornerae]TWX60835.1 acylneuraminate cytidylyltransferase family protein [Colwellia hornerae]TWX69165.1 acylneuraminate cytidylyltransferase family protein [Colwellia hornerae]
MINGKKVCAIIPSRGGSKRLPGKNVLPLHGKPLIAWTIEAGLNSQYIDRVVVSTDCEDIAKVAIDFGADVPFMRPSEIATDTASTDSVILHFLSTLSVANYPDIVVILQPTSPLRTEQDIDQALSLLIQKEAEGIVSVCECEHSPFWSNILPADLNMGTFIKNDIKGKRSQDLPPCYRLNGAVYVFTSNSFVNMQGISYTDSVFSFIMPGSRSIDIDHELDFRLAEVILDNNENRNLSKGI